jgi:hypothetical protein
MRYAHVVAKRIATLQCGILEWVPHQTGSRAVHQGSFIVRVQHLIGGMASRLTAACGGGG